MVVKPLEAALADNDHIYAVILGSAINSNGARAPLHAPSGVAQQECIRAAFAQAGRDPKDVDFVECHATVSFPTVLTDLSPDAFKGNCCWRSN